MGKRAVLYARVSGDDRGKDGRNLKGQLEMCRDYALAQGYTIVAELAEDDRGASGADIDLEKLTQALEMARSRAFEVLVVRELDRFARSLAKQLIVETEFKRADVELDYVLGEYPDTPEGNLLKNVRAVVAEYERLKIAERTARARFSFVKSGNVLCHGKSPYGYQLVEKNGRRTLEIYEPEARVVRMIFEWYIHGRDGEGRISMYAIARDLSELQIPTLADKRNTYKIAEPGQWAPSSVASLLGNETYTGTWHYGKEHFVDGKLVKNPQDHLIEVSVPAIVSREVFDAAQARRKENKKLAKRRCKYDYLLSGRVVCGACNHKMTGATYRRGKRWYRYYLCHGKSAYSPGACAKSLSFPLTAVESAIWERIRRWMTDPQELRAELRRCQVEKERENAPLGARLAVLDDLLAENRRQMDRLLDLYLAGDFAKEMLTERKKRLEDTIEALERERKTLIATLEAGTLTDEQIETISGFSDTIEDQLRIADGDFAAKRRIVEMLDTQVTLYDQDGIKTAQIRCFLGQDVFAIASTTT